MFSKVLGLATAFAAVASALPAPIPSPSSSNSTGSATGGGVTINNNMDQTLYGWSVADTAETPMITIPAGGTYSESWRLNPNNGGISIKLSTAQSQSDVLQFEYTLVDPLIYWDLSCINMGTASLFTNAGFSVESNDSQCQSATCAPGDAACAAAYLYPTDDQATHGCQSTTHMTLSLGSSQ
jgi:hypothetical protein